MTSPPHPRHRASLQCTSAKLLAPVAAVLLLSACGGGPSEEAVTFEARQGDLEITVLEGGNIEALESQIITSEVRGQTKILEIVDEGYLITPEDVANEKVLVRLDDSDLEERLTSAEIEYQNALAQFTDAREQYEIQIKQNESDIKAAELEARFMLMDFQKYLGSAVAGDIISSRGLNELQEEIFAASAALETGRLDDVLPPPPPPKEASRSGTEDALEEAIAEPVVEAVPDIDFTQYADVDVLDDGEAKQRLRQLMDEMLLAEEELGLARTTLDGTQRLAEQDFVTQSELENDEMAVRRKEISLEAAQTALDLFIRYEFPKQAEKYLSDYEESLRKLERVQKQAVSKLAQAMSRMRSNEAQYRLKTSRRDELIEQIEKCVITAERTGLVVYATSQDRWDDRRIEPGAAVNERDEIIIIPDMERMALNVKVHESDISKVKVGLPARITVDSYPEAPLTGKIHKVAVLPDSQSRWLNPDLKEYTTLVAIDGAYDWLKPGASAEAEIIIDRLEDVVYVPLHAVHRRGDDDIVYVASAGVPSPRAVQTGEYTSDFVSIREGLNVGEQILLRAPDGFELDSPAPEQPVAAR